MDCWLCGKPVGFPVYVPTDDGFKPAHRACAVAAITVPPAPVIPVTGKED